AYPSTWEETSCVALIEAMSASCLAVVSDLGALPETASGFAQLYSYNEDKTQHAKRFAEELTKAIDLFWSLRTQEHLFLQKQYFDAEYGWTARALEWENLLKNALRNT